MGNEPAVLAGYRSRLPYTGRFFVLYNVVPVQVCLHCTVYFIILFRVRFHCTR